MSGDKRARSGQIVTQQPCLAPNIWHLAGGPMLYQCHV